jgi:hypothetical protein
MRLVFDGEWSRAYILERSATDLVFTFNHFEPTRTGFDKPNFSVFYERLGVSQVIVLTKKNDWFLNTDLPELLKSCAAVASSFTNVACYGFSMGGYAAMIFSAAVRANRVALISPQFTIDRAKAPFEDRWRGASATIDFSLESFDDRIAQDAAGFVVFDPNHDQDSRHARMILEKAPNWTPIRLWYGQHPASKFLVETGTLRAFGHALLGPSPTRLGLEKIYRNARGRSPSYLNYLAEKTIKRRPAVALELTRRGMATDLSKGGPWVPFLTGHQAYRLGLPGALEVMEAGASKLKTHPTWWHHAIRAALHKKLDQAEAEADRLRARVAELERENARLTVGSSIWWYRRIRSILMAKIGEVRARHAVQKN